MSPNATNFQDTYIRFNKNFVINPSSGIPPHPGCVVTLPCEISDTAMTSTGPTAGLFCASLYTSDNTHRVVHFRCNVDCFAAYSKEVNKYCKVIAFY